MKMHYDIRYEHADPEVNHKKALNDVADYLGGQTKYDQIVEAIKLDGLRNWNKFRLTFAFMAGIEGYPVKALYKEVWGVDPMEEDNDNNR